MKALNNIIVNSGRMYSGEPAGYMPFTFTDSTVYLDINSLALFEASQEELSAPASVTPQYPFCPNRHVRALVFHVTHSCQLRCDYCYVMNEYQDTSGFMKFETAKEAIDTLINKQVFKTSKLRIGFFGGEALLNFPVIKQITDYATGLFGENLHFGITTNGCTITKEIAQFLAKFNFSVVVSVDGPESIHNHHRKYANGSPTYIDVVSGLELLRDAGVRNVTLRGTFTPAFTFLLERTKALNEMCHEKLATGVSIEPAFLSESSCMRAKMETSYDFHQLEEEYLAVADYLAESLVAGRPAFFKNIMTFVERLVYRQQHVTECGAGVGYVSVNPEGTIFACHRQMNSKIGELQRGGIDEFARAKWVENRCILNTACQKCGLRNVCGGPCREHSLGVVGSIDGVDPVACKFKHLWIKSAIRIIQRLPGLSLTQLVPRKKNRVTSVSTKVSLPAVEILKNVNFVREGGGLGDIISMGAAARALRKASPETGVTLCIPDDFVDVAKHFPSVNSVVSLGPLNVIGLTRRQRGQKPIPFTLPEGRVVDLWCPGYAYEIASQIRLEYTRSQIFAKEAGCANLADAIPEWLPTKDERIFASQFLWDHFGEKGPVIGLCPRGTLAMKNIPFDILEKLIISLCHGFKVVYFDCIPPSIVHENLVWSNCEFCQAVAICEQCNALITVDTSFLHVGCAVQVPTLGVFTLTDSKPYESLYPWFKAVQPSIETEYCKIPCNRSPQKGWKECKTQCVRQRAVTSDLIMNGLFELFRLSADKKSQAERLKRFTT